MTFEPLDSKQMKYSLILSTLIQVRTLVQNLWPKFYGNYSKRLLQTLNNTKHLLICIPMFTIDLSTLTTTKCRHVTKNWSKLMKTYRLSSTWNQISFLKMFNSSLSLTLFLRSVVLPPFCKFFSLSSLVISLINNGLTQFVKKSNLSKKKKKLHKIKMLIKKKLCKELVLKGSTNYMTTSKTFKKIKIINLDY